MVPTKLSILEIEKPKRFALLRIGQCRQTCKNYDVLQRTSQSMCLCNRKTRETTQSIKKTHGSFSLKNVTIIGNQITEDGEYADYRSNAMGSTENIYAYGFKSSSDVELDNDGVATNYNNGLLSFGTWEVVLPEGIENASDIFVNKGSTVIVTDFGSTATAISQGANTVGATTSLLNWTYANTKAGLGF